MRSKIALHPKRPERICWGCDKYCPMNDLRCGNGTIRTPHPAELFGEDWMEWELDTGHEPQTTHGNELPERMNAVAARLDTSDFEESGGGPGFPAHHVPVVRYW